MEELNWKTYLRNKMRVFDDEREMYFVLLLSHLSPAFWFLVFGYVLIHLRFMPKHLSGRFPNVGHWPGRRLQIDVAVDTK